METKCFLNLWVYFDPYLWGGILRGACSGAAVCFWREGGASCPLVNARGCRDRDWGNDVRKTFRKFQLLKGHNQTMGLIWYQKFWANLSALKLHTSCLTYVWKADFLLLSKTSFLNLLLATIHKYLILPMNPFEWLCQDPYLGYCYTVLKVYIVLFWYSILMYHTNQLEYWKILVRILDCCTFWDTKNMQRSVFGKYLWLVTLPGCSSVLQYCEVEKSPPQTGSQQPRAREYWQFK